MTAAKQTPARPDGPADPTSGPHAKPVAGHGLLDAAFEAQANSLRGLIETWQRHLGFVAHRLDRNRELISDLASARAAPDMSSILVSYAATAQTEYWEEMKRALNQSAKRAQEATETAQEQVRELAKIAAETADRRNPASARAA